MKGMYWKGTLLKVLRGFLITPFHSPRVGNFMDQVFGFFLTKQGLKLQLAEQITLLCQFIVRVIRNQYSAIWLIIEILCDCDLSFCINCLEKKEFDLKVTYSPKMREREREKEHLKHSRFEGLNCFLLEYYIKQDLAECFLYEKLYSFNSRHVGKIIVT